MSRPTPKPSSRISSIRGGAGGLSVSYSSRMAARTACTTSSPISVRPRTSWACSAACQGLFLAVSADDALRDKAYLSTSNHLCHVAPPPGIESIAGQDLLPGALQARPGDPRPRRTPILLRSRSRWAPSGTRSYRSGSAPGIPRSASLPPLPLRLRTPERARLR